MSQTKNTSKVLDEILFRIDCQGTYYNQMDRSHEKELVGTQKYGSIVNVRKPEYSRFTAGRTIAISNSREETLPIRLDQEANLAKLYTLDELAMNLSEPGSKKIAEIANAATEYIDQYCSQMFLEVANNVGTPGTSVSTLLTIAQARKKLLQEGVDMADARMIIDPDASMYLNAQIRTLQQDELVKQAVVSGRLGKLSGFNIFESNNVPNFTQGNATTTGVTVTNTITDGVNTIALGGFTTATTIKKGTTFTISSAYQVNASSGLASKSLRDFVVLADATASGSACTITFAPAFITTGNYATVSSSASTGAAITFAGAKSSIASVNIAFVPEAFTLVMGKLPVPKSAGYAESKTLNGITMNMVLDWDQTYGKETARFDILFGGRCLNPQLATRIYGL